METESLQLGEKQLILAKKTETTADNAKLVENDKDNEKGQSSLSGASINSINSIIGSGILGMPYAMRSAGLPLGFILMFGVAIVTDYSLVLLIKGGHLSGTNTYQDLVRAAFGKPGYIWLSAIQFLYPFIAMISYNIIIGDTMTKVLMRIFRIGSEHVLANRYFVISLSTVLVTLPISAYRNISKLVKISVISIVMVAFIVTVIIIRLATLGPQIPPTSHAWEFANIHFTQAIGVMAFAFVCHHNSFLIYDSLEEPTVKRWSIVAHYSVFISLLVTALFGACGYATFTGYTQGDILENYCSGDDLVNAARFIYGVTLMFTFPIECFVTREVLDNIICNLGYAEKPQTLTRHLVETLILVALTLGISMSTDCLGIVLELNGVLGAVPLVFILPAAAYLKLEEGKLYSLHKLPAILICIIGVFTMVMGSVMSGCFAAVQLVFILPGLCYLKLQKSEHLGMDKFLSGGLVFTGILVSVIGVITSIVFYTPCNHGNDMWYCNQTTLNNTNMSYPIG